MQSNDTFFKTYDIRGVFPSEINAAVFQRIGFAFGTYLRQLKKKKRLTMSVGRDLRASSEELANAFMKGVIAAGVCVIDIGEVTTPLSYFAPHALRIDGGAMITASHNPAEYNGLKLTVANLKHEPVQIGMGSGLEKVKELYNRNGVMVGVEEKDNEWGEITQKNIIGDYVKFLLRGVSLSRPLHIAVDASGGAALRILPELFNAAGIDYKPMFFEPDPMFRLHGPNPEDDDAREFIAREMKRDRYDAGVLFDGDGDRIFFFDETGSVAHPDVVSALIAEEILKKHPKSNIVIEVAASRMLQDAIEAAGGIARRSKVGTVIVKQTMRRFKALFGGETSGHYYFKDFWYHDSAMMAMLKILSIIAASSKPFSELVASHPKPIQWRKRYSVREDAGVVLKRLENHFAMLGGTVDALDGVSVMFPEWWFNIRSSNTEPIIKLMIEAKSEAMLEEKLKEIEAIIHEMP
ncbi:phosphomannomutase/phosphoglucomutase [Patescibacteria group bacterium]|nr:phosphomannomutase/phosphoglucomutase [Patescibacteria group bacterium]